MPSVAIIFPTVICLLQFLTASGQSVVKMSMDKHQNTGKVEENVQKQFSFASYYSDHMVLQRAPKSAIIWGYAPDEDEQVTITHKGVGYMAKVYRDPSNNYTVWKTKLAAEDKPGPFRITAKRRGKTIELNDVMFGDVWVCSGQSNMQFTLVQALNATKELADANNYPDIRLFTVSDIPSAFPLLDLKGILENWLPADNASVGGKPWKYFSAVCWLYGKYLYKELGYPIGLIDTTWGGTPVEAWSSPDALAKCGLKDQPYEIDYAGLARLNKNGFDAVVGPGSPSNLWNGMVNPLINMTIYGAIWYQGEANTIANVHKYNCTFPSMIEDWRLKFHEGSEGETDSLFPFGFVQLAANAPDSMAPGFPEIRWHQTADFGYVPNARMPNVFMAVAIDLPDFASPWGSIHPRDKQDVAARLTLSALSVAYKRKGIMFQGPFPNYITEGVSNITIIYDSEIVYRDLIGFEALCTVKNSKLTFWTSLAVLPPMKAKTKVLTLWSGSACGQGEKIIGLRYLWQESPCAFKLCTVYSADDPLLPAPPYIMYKDMTNKEGTVHKLDWTKPVAIVS